MYHYFVLNKLKMNFLRVQSSDLLSKYFGQTEEKIRNLFQIARSTSPSLLFFDDFDALAHKR
jgi:SpoVK/Ycf46/Vps4 family AAA+-type ATPase